MLSAGYDDRLAQAMIANSWAESGLSNAPPDGDSGHSIGLFQLNDNGGAGAGMTVEERRDPYINTRRIMADYGFKKVVSAWASGASAPDLAYLFCVAVERPSDSDRKGRERAEFARLMFPTSNLGSSMSTPPHFSEDIRPLLEGILGQPYWYGAGGLDCPWPIGGPGGGANAPFGYDCSGFVLRAWQHLGLIHKKTPVGRRAADLGAFVERVELGQQAPGDAAFYASDGSTVSHVQLVVLPPDPALDGHSLCYGANGGGSSTLGSDPEACVKEAPGNYWSKFAFYGRVPSIHAAQARPISHVVFSLAGGLSLAEILGLPATLTAPYESVFRGYAMKLYPKGW